MGEIYRAKCTDCGFSSEFKLGGSRMNFREYQPVPAINLAANTFENPNYAEAQNDGKYKFFLGRGYV